MPLLAKICLLGDGEVGKTSLMSSYLKRGFTTEYIPTIGSDFLSKQVTLDTKLGRKDLQFQIWDLAGQPAFDQVRKLYYKGSAGAFLVFDLTYSDSLENLDKWLDEFSKNIQTEKSSIFLLGNKLDLTDEVKVFPDTIECYINNHLVDKFSNVDPHIEYYQTSAKTGENVDKAFSLLGRRIIELHYSSKGDL
ncbi:MAG: GTP-binding protein [Candidatus Heimdallarchaeota archaeon]|nr:MAG: GTP-binding protein [Candidatus Heimdallarchaeota archaeon]